MAAILVVFFADEISGKKFNHHCISRQFITLLGTQIFVRPFLPEKNLQSF